MSTYVAQYAPLELFCLWTKVHQISLSTWKGLRLIKFFQMFDYVDQFRRYSRSKSKVLRNRAEIWTFLALKNFRGLTFQKWYSCYYTSLAARGLEKFREGTSASREVIGAHTLDFRPNVKFLQIFASFRGDLRPHCGVRYVALLNV